LAKLQALNGEKSLLEQELVRTKQELGEALNQAYEFERIYKAMIGA
jgi:hypothetical protein